MSTHATPPVDRNQGGFALITVLFVVVAVAVLATGATIVGSANVLGNRYYSQQGNLSALAETGLEAGRAALNSDRSLYPDDGYIVLEDGTTPNDAQGNPMTGIKRWTYAGPTGSITGQYGVFGSLVSVVKDGAGGVAIQRSQVFQESFAKYAYFTDIEPSNIRFGGGDQIFGPVHTNSDIKVYSSGATFHDEVRMAGTVIGGEYADFRKGYQTGVSPIAMPETAELDKLKNLAAQGGMTFTGPGGSHGEASLRIEFVAIDLNGDGDTDDSNEGFLKAYRSNNIRWVSGDTPGGSSYDGMRNSRNCGTYHNGQFVTIDEHPFNGMEWWEALASPQRRCFLGGADETNSPDGFVPNDGQGEWLQWGGAVSPLLAGRPDAAYLFPLSRSMNPNFKGVIHVDGSVVVSGTLRGRVTLAATEDIVIGDDLVYVTDPGVGSCVDIMGFFAGDDVVVADNLLNAPYELVSSWPHYTYDDTKDEFIHGIVLALDIFTVENFNSGSTNAEWCEGTSWGRGCLYLTGGIIQRVRGAVGTTAGTGGLKRYAYDKCGATAPPPYYPTTGHFARGQQYLVDPAGFEVGDLYNFLTSN